MASKPFEELHLNLIGPITPISHKEHKFILTTVDRNTRFVLGTPIVAKLDDYATLSHLIEIEAKRLGITSLFMSSHCMSSLLIQLTVDPLSSIMTRIWLCQ